MPERLAVDIGGTFIDIITIDVATDTLSVEKVHSDPDRLADAVLNGIARGTTSLADKQSFIHGTTLGVNALLERKGAQVGIITTEGFRDVLELGRYDVPDNKLYDFSYEKPDPLVPRFRRIGVPGRLDASGEEIEPLDEDAVREAGHTLVEDYGVDSIVIAFIHSYINPGHERTAAALIQEEYPSVEISISSDIVREHYEYERTSTATLDAYIKPIFGEYVKELKSGLTGNGFDGSFLITRSGGGALPAETAQQYPVHTILSGPAGGIVGAANLATITGSENLITYDMGGTSLETSVIRNGSPTVRHEADLEHQPLMIPVFDIRTIGAGGGSIAWTDGSLLKVGPESAGAVPGPICYDQGGSDPTVTDAAVTLGYIQPDAFLGGDLVLDIDGAASGIRSKVAEHLDMSVQQAAVGIMEVTVNKHVAAIREITIEKGLDPRDFSILAFGGAGPMLAPLVMKELGSREVIVPSAPALFSAWGMLMVDVIHDRSTTQLEFLDDLEIEALEQAFINLESEVTATLTEEGYPVEDQSLHQSVEMRYLGQEQTVKVTVDALDTKASLNEQFDTNHRDQYGHTLDDPVEVVYQRVRGIGHNDKPEPQPSSVIEAGQPTSLESIEMYCFAEEDLATFDIFDRDELHTGLEIQGPAIVQEPTTTTVVMSEQRISVTDYDHLIIEEVNA